MAARTANELRMEALSLLVEGLKKPASPEAIRMFLESELKLKSARLLVTAEARGQEQGTAAGEGGGREAEEKTEAEIPKPSSKKPRPSARAEPDETVMKGEQGPEEEGKPAEVKAKKAGPAVPEGPATPEPEVKAMPKKPPAKEKEQAKEKEPEETSWWKGRFYRKNSYGQWCRADPPSDSRGPPETPPPEPKTPPPQPPQTPPPQNRKRAQPAGSSWEDRPKKKGPGYSKATRFAKAMDESGHLHHVPFFRAAWNEHDSGFFYRPCRACGQKYWKGFGCENGGCEAYLH